MKTLKALKSRREGVEKINKIARAMEAIAGSRLRRYEEEVLRLRPYIQAEQSVMKSLALRLKKRGSLWAQPLAEKRGLVILISSDRGFCGSFNNQLFQLVKGLNQVRFFSFIAVGRKGAGFLKKQHFDLIGASALPANMELSDFIQELTGKIISSYREGRQKVYLVFNKFRRNLLGQGFLKQLLPLDSVESKEFLPDYLFEPDAEKVTDEILSVYVTFEIKAAILESKAAEEMARMVAMTQASRSAEDLIKSLTLQYHKARQAGITRELVEIANAIR